jgi:radial spoke head protein 4A
MIERQKEEGEEGVFTELVPDPINHVPDVLT